jgi:SPFH domain / Band 7 family
MDTDAFLGASLTITTISLAVLSVWIRRSKAKKRLIVLEFQRGVKFENGAFRAVLEPGSYRIDSKKEQIAIVDMRPLPILIEQCSFQDSHQQAAYLSIAAELVVVDPRAVTKESKDHVNDAVLAIREVIRQVGPGYDASGLKSRRADIECELLERSRKELARLGLTLSQLTVTDTSSNAGMQRTAGFVSVNR